MSKQHGGESTALWFRSTDDVKQYGQNHIPKFDRRNKRLPCESIMSQEIQCSACFKWGTKLSVCKGCKSASYCSRDCQAKDWKHHKSICKAKQAVRKASKQHGVKDTYKCFRSWVDRVNGTDILFQFALQAGATRDMLTKQPSTHLIMCHIEFDFNARSFLPTKKPWLVPVGSLYGQLREGYNQTYDSFMPGCKHVIAFSVESALLNELILFSAHRFTIREEVAMTEMELSQRISQCEPTDAPLIEKFSDAWKEKASSNIIKQHNVLATDPAFRHLIWNALHLDQEEALSLVRTHVVVFDVKTSRRLGDIVKLQRFRTRSILELAEEISDELTVVFHAARLTNATLVVYLDNSKWEVHPVIYKLTKSDDVQVNRKPETEDEWTRKALRAFVDLTKVVLPSVESPTSLDHLNY